MRIKAKLTCSFPPRPILDYHHKSLLSSVCCEQISLVFESVTCTGSSLHVLVDGLSVNTDINCHWTGALILARHWLTVCLETCAVYSSRALSWVGLCPNCTDYVMKHTERIFFYMESAKRQKYWHISNVLWIQGKNIMKH